MVQACIGAPIKDPIWDQLKASLITLQSYMNAIHGEWYNSIGYVAQDLLKRSLLSRVRHIHQQCQCVPNKLP